MLLLLCLTAGSLSTQAGSIAAWGRDDYGQVSNAPTGTGFTAIAAGASHGYALRADGSIAAWGRDLEGQVSNAPTGTGFTAIAAGGSHGYALRADGSIAAWGWDFYRQVSNAPTGTGFTAIAAGGSHGYALRADGSIAAWGRDLEGQVSNAPTGTGFTAIAAGGVHGYALRADGSIAAWGYDSHGQVSNTPMGTGFTAIAAGGYNGYALRADGSIAAWGNDGSGQVSNTPTETGFTAIAAGQFNNGYAVRADGSIAAWGDDGYGQVSNAPTGTGFTAIAAGFYHGYVLGDLNTAPTADAGADQSIHAGNTVYLDGSGSFDDNTASTALSYSWSFAEKPAGSSATLMDANTATPSFFADLDGNYIVQLVVTDEGGLSGDPDEVLISSNNQAPTANATATTVLPVVGFAVNLDGTGSTDPDMDAITYDWTVTSRPAGSTAAIVNADSALASLVPDMAGEYEVTLNVSDFLGAGTPATVTFVASSASSYAEQQILSAADTLEGLSSSQVTTKGNQNALGNFLSQAVKQLQDGDVAGAIEKLNQAIERTDGCPLRGAPDGNGPGRDWVTDCAAQQQIYDNLTAALTALQN